ncbi:SusC/RagA family TonB-linked outer membrane protein [Belliella kenyensis]|nr:SusC/RagA family TonB-linked outer membrane protein [Belliella kenyensis]MDN3604044.1 SusC/RagA family TonB-linked outer membrane protein [Belliella kenyensis]
MKSFTKDPNLLADKQRDPVRVRMLRKSMLLLLISFFSLTVNALPQKVTIELNQKPLREAFDLLKRKSDAVLFFSHDEIDLSQVVSGKFYNQEIEEVLEKLIGQNYNVSVREGNVYIISPKKTTDVIKTVVDQVRVRGKVISVNGEPMPGSIIRVKGTTLGSVTDADGDFSMMVPSNESILVVSFIGFITREVTVGNQTELTIILEEETTALSEVTVVSTGFMDVDKRRFTGAVSSLDGRDVKMEGPVDISRMLEGRASGVSVQNVSGTFGSAPKLRIRGATSITGDNKPLWVVDGVILEDVVNVSNDQLASGDPMTLIGSSVAGINADDIESFDILKDAAATALYGARAMNGVVVITTKKGRVGKPIVTYTGNYSTYLKPNYSNFNIMNSVDQMSVYAEMYRKGWLNHASTANASDGGVFVKMYNLINTYDETTGQFGLQNTPEARAQFLDRYARGNTDWFDILFRNSFVQEHSLSISSGTENSRHYFSASYYNDNGWTIADNVNRYTANLRSNYDISNRLELGVIATASIREQRTPGTVNRVNDVVRGAYARDFDINPFSYALNTSRVLTAYDENGDLEFFTRNYAPFNIIHETENNFVDLNMLDFKLQLDATYKFNDNLKYTALGSYRYVKTNRQHNVTEYSNMAEAYRQDWSSLIRSRNRFLFNDPDFPAEEAQVVLPQGGLLNRNENYLKNFYARHMLQWNKEFSGGHFLSLFGGQEIKYTDRQTTFFNGYGFQFDKGGVPFTDYRIIKQTLLGNFNYFDQDLFYDRFVGFFSNVNYAYDGKYVAEFTTRYDGSNMMGNSRQARWLPTWTVSGAWNVDQENFMQQYDKIDYLKFRASYGLTASMGNATNSRAIFQSNTTLRPYPSEMESLINIQSLENSELTWEKNFTSNFGLDLGLWNGAVNITAEYYRRDMFDLINTVRTSGIGGQATKSANYADMKSSGVDLNIGHRYLTGTDWEWRGNLTFSYNQTRITNLKNNPRIFDLVKPEGGPSEGGAVRGLYSIPFVGLDPSTGIPLFINENGETSSNVYLQSIAIDNLIYEGPVDPTIFGGYSNSFKYKNFNIAAFFTYQAGHKIRLNPTFRGIYSDLDAMPREFLNRWTLPGDELVTDIPAIMDPIQEGLLGSVYPYNNYNYSSARVADGSFVKLRTMTFGYMLPRSFVDKMQAQNVTINLHATNLWTIYADKKLNGQDPEFFNSGGVALPLPRQFTLSLKAIF